MGQYEVRILDIGQAVIHDYLTWGILIQIPDASHSSPVIRDLLFRFHALDLQVRFAPITPEEYQQWAQGRNRACYIINAAGAGHNRRTDCAGVGDYRAPPAQY